MNYYDIMQHYWALRTQEVLNSSTGDLYLFLINQCVLRGKNTINIKSNIICEMLNINRNYLSQRRKLLQDAELIEFSAGKNAGEIAEYKILCIQLDTQNSKVCIQTDTQSFNTNYELDKVCIQKDTHSQVCIQTDTHFQNETEFKCIQKDTHSKVCIQTDTHFQDAEKVCIQKDTQNPESVYLNGYAEKTPYIYISNNISNNIDDDILKSENENFQKDHQSDLEAKNNNQNILRAVPVAVVDPIEGMKPSEILKKYKPTVYLLAAKSGEIPFDKIDEQLALFDEHNIDTKFNDVTHILNNWRSVWCKNYTLKQQKQAESNKASNQAQNVYKAPRKLTEADYD